MIDALTKSLGDKHTSYFNPKDAEEFSSALSGDFEGIGAVIKEHPIDTKGTIGMSSSDAVELIRGPK